MRKSCGGRARLRLRSWRAEARERGANAVMGVDIDYEVLGERNGMMMVSVSGTAVELK